MTQLREIACAIIIDTCGRFLLQQRDDVLGIIQPGKISLFGGHREGTETFLECVVREIHEEISYYIPAERFAQLRSYDGADWDVDDGLVRAEFFVTRNIPIEALVITEGSLLIVNPDEIFDLQAKLAPSTLLALSWFLTDRLAIGLSGRKA